MRNLSLVELDVMVAHLLASGTTAGAIDKLVLRMKERKTFPNYGDIDIGQADHAPRRR